VSGAAAGPDAPRSSQSLALRSLLAALWFAAWFFVLIPGGLLWLAGADLVPPGGATRAIGVLVIVAAHFPLIPLVASFVIHGRGTHAPFDPPRRMIASGIYRRVRNPMYLLYTIVILGEAIAYRSVLLLAYAGLFWLVAHFLVVNFEENTLRRRFGVEYEAYCRRVPRWIPRLRANADH
jgi:protein-S-isoprenylcysteine O-methyltransferase Ste14